MYIMLLFVDELWLLGLSKNISIKKLFLILKIFQINYGFGGLISLHMDEDGMFNVGGGRFTTAMLYLSEVQSGGFTIFPKLNLAFRPQPGQLLYWNLRR